VLNKSLQTLISERTQSTEAVARDLDMMHTSLQTVLKALNLPPMTQLQGSKLSPQTPSSEPNHNDDFGPSCDNSPRMTPADETDLPNVPIHSVYHLTKLSALRSPDIQETKSFPKKECNVKNDFITRGVIALSDAERLFRLYMDHLDAFIYGVGGRYSSLDSLRQSSEILTVSLLTVAALHDGQSNTIYGACSKEFRRVFSASIFSRKIDRDYLRAMCIAAYWLSDISWILSGHAIRRAAEFNLINHYKSAITDHNEDSMDYVRIWYVLFICDQHSSTLFSRKSVIHEDSTILGCEAFHKSPLATDDDRRVVSQVALLNIIHNIHNLFGPDTGEPVPQIYLMQIADFSRQLDQWLGRWSSALIEYHKSIGTFPRKGVLIHFHFAKLHLYSHVFRGLQNSSIPSHFLDCVNQGIHSATAIVNLLVTDADLQAGLVGMPSYLHSMTGFACMFLAKLATIYGGDLVDRNMVVDITSRLIEIYRKAPVGKWHLVHLMANGLEKIVKTLNPSVTSPLQPQLHHEPLDQDAHHFPDLGGVGFLDNDSLDVEANFLTDYNMSMGASQLMYLSSGPTAFDTSELSPTFL
jgi:hypothetical protein